jgi:hypothetical protein
LSSGLDVEHMPEMGSRGALKCMTDAAIERHRSRGRLQLITGGNVATEENASEDAQPRNEHGYE